MQSARFKALLVDIDDTIIRFKPGHESDSLFHVLQSASASLNGMSPDETNARIEEVKRESIWWHWSDFIVALELNPKQFWSYALEQERRYIEPTGPEIRHALERIHAAGVLLYVTSNNPSSGILHKLNIADLGSLTGAPLFSQLLGCYEIRAMKWDSLYWKKVLAHVALDPTEVAVVGDNPKDDCEVPHSVGIAHSFLINRGKDLSFANSDRVTHVMSFDQIADDLLSDSNGRARFGEPSCALTSQ